MKARDGAAGIQAGGHKLLRPPSLPHLSSTAFCLIEGLQLGNMFIYIYTHIHIYMINMMHDAENSQILGEALFWKEQKNLGESEGFLCSVSSAGKLTKPRSPSPRG